MNKNNHLLKPLHWKKKKENEQVCYLTTDGTEKYEEILNQMCPSMYMF